MRPDLSEPLVLVVDDQNDNLRFLGEVLDRAGYRVMPALTGQVALSRAALRRPDIALLDIAMPDLDGIETCRRLRELPGLRDLPVLFVTGATQKSALDDAFAAGAVDYVAKPFVVNELLVRIRTHLDLHFARQRLEAMVREREDMTDVVAHDLKNPLTCILFAAQALAQQADDQRSRELAGEINECTEEALRYIQRFLARGAHDERLRQFTVEPIGMAVVAREALRLQTTAARQRGVSVSIEGDSQALADPVSVRNVIQNLVANAVHHSPPGASVVVRLSRLEQPPRAKCEVIDSGYGVPMSIRPRLFERFVHEPVISTGNAYSSGLGLAIARHDVSQMGGRIWYTPRAEGGSVFAFELPTPDRQGTQT